MFTPERLPKSMDEHRKIYSVAELTRLIKVMLENEIGTVWVEGEISNFIHHTSGHMYFALKDADGLIRAAMFRGNQRGLTMKPANGLLVRAYGRVSAYPQRSEFQIVVERLEPAGKGTLQEQFEKLKEKLSSEGLFDPERKKALPLLPQHIGIVTSPTGAAIRDILNILERRFPNLHIIIAPVKVQGEGAAEEIAAAIDLFNQRGGIDVMIVGRGGGSLEDLWSFNEEIVARAIARSRIPIISAVGHEVDFTISDFVADQRAPTPSAAAELAVRPKADYEELIRAQERRLVQALRARALELKNRLVRVARSYVFREPHNLVQKYRQRLDHLHRQALNELRSTFRQKQQLTDELGLRLAHRVELRTKACAQQVERLASQLRALSPLAVLDRGYSITRRVDGDIVRSAEAVQAGETVETRVARGSFQSVVTDKLKGNGHGRKKD